ncbi:MAG: hypothetical protein ACRCUY_13040 [Thermoguttaceae bacterium]
MTGISSNSAVLNCCAKISVNTREKASLSLPSDVTRLPGLRLNQSPTNAVNLPNIFQDSLSISQEGQVICERILKNTGATQETLKYKGTVSQSDGKIISEYEGENHAASNEKGEWTEIPSPRIGFSQEAGKEGGFGGLFAGFDNPFSSLGKLLGLKGTMTERNSLLSSLEKAISDESEELTKTISGLLSEVGLEAETKKITFSEDADGNIVVTGNISAKQKKQLAQLVNSDPKLVERIKTQKARMEIAGELNSDEPDFSNKKFDAARTQLLKNFLEKSGFSLGDINNEMVDQSGWLKFTKQDENGNETSNDSMLQMFDKFPEIGSEIKAYFDRTNAPKATITEAQQPQSITVSIAGEEIADSEKDDEPVAVRSLLSMKRGVLSEASEDEPDAQAQVDKLRQMISGIVAKVNEMYQDDFDANIADYTMKIDSKGKLKITDVRTKGNDPEANRRAEQIMNSWIDSDAKEIGGAILELHDDEHGDTKEYKHEVIIASGFYSDYKIESKEADAAAMKEIETLTQEIGTELGKFFTETLGISEPFSVLLKPDGLFAFDISSMTPENSRLVSGVLDEMNNYLNAIYEGDETSAKLSPELVGVADKIVKLKAAQEKLHDKDILPKTGIRFQFSK